MDAKVLTELSKRITSKNAIGLPLFHRGNFIKQFGGPGGDTGIICFKFWELVSAAGCPYQCSYCFLQATPSYVFGQYPIRGALFENWKDMVAEVEKWLEHPIPRMMMVGELQDGLAFDYAYKKVGGKTLTDILIPLFAGQDRHQLLFLTKSVAIKNALKLPPTNRVIFSWSVNAREASRRWEIGAPSPDKRLEAARMMKDAGWSIRFRLDPMIPFEGWRQGYKEIIDELNDIRPEMITLGALRASNTLQSHAERNGRDASLFDLLTVKDPSGFKKRLPDDVHIKLFKYAIEHIDADNILVALCKEDISVWRSVGLKFRGCHCMIGSKDEVVLTRKKEMGVR